MKNLFILEGPDCSGKTTLAKYIARYFNGVYFHCDYTERLGEAMRDYQSNVLDNALFGIHQLGQVWVIDRLWPSEFIYSKVFRPHMHEAAKETASQLDELVKQNDGIYVFCDDSDVVARHENQKDSAHPYDKEAFQQVVFEYRELFQGFHEDYYVNYNLQVWGHNLTGYCEFLKNL